MNRNNLITYTLRNYNSLSIIGLFYHYSKFKAIEHYIANNKIPSSQPSEDGILL